jgi:acyl-CoA thioesterase-1
VTQRDRTLTVVHMGDSITVAQYLESSASWTSVIAHRLRLLLEARDCELISINRGVSGETTRQGLERYPEAVQDVGADLMTLQYGLNDCNRWETDRGAPRVSERAFAANLFEMITRARSFGVRHVILQTNHRTLRRSRLPGGVSYEDANARYSELAREVAAESGVDLCDIRAAFEPFSDQELERLLLPAPDHLHLSEEGNMVYADTIWPHIEACVSEILDGISAHAAALR